MSDDEKLITLDNKSFQIMKILKEEELIQARISEQCKFSHVTVKRRTNELEELGFIERDNNRVYHLTDSGKEFIDYIDKVKEGVDEMTKKNVGVIL